MQTPPSLLLVKSMKHKHTFMGCKNFIHDKERQWFSGIEAFQQLSK